MKKIFVYLGALAFLLGFSKNVLADNSNSQHILVAHNAYAMTLTKLALTRDLEQCEMAKSNFEKEFPEKTKIVFKCIPVPNKVF